MTDEIEDQIIDGIIWYAGDKIEINGMEGYVAKVGPRMLTIEYLKPRHFDDSTPSTRCICRKDKPTRIDY